MSGPPLPVIRDRGRRRSSIKLIKDEIAELRAEMTLALEATAAEKAKLQQERQESDEKAELLEKELYTRAMAAASAAENDTVISSSSGLTGSVDFEKLEKLMECSAVSDTSDNNANHGAKKLGFPSLRIFPGFKRGSGTQQEDEMIRNHAMNELANVQESNRSTVELLEAQVTAGETKLNFLEAKSLRQQEKINSLRSQILQARWHSRKKADDDPPKRDHENLSLDRVRTLENRLAATSEDIKSSMVEEVLLTKRFAEVRAQEEVAKIKTAMRINILNEQIEAANMGKKTRKVLARVKRRNSFKVIGMFSDSLDDVPDDMTRDEIVMEVNMRQSLLKKMTKALNRDITAIKRLKVFAIKPEIITVFSDLDGQVASITTQMDSEMIKCQKVIRLQNELRQRDSTVVALEQKASSYQSKVSSLRDDLDHLRNNAHQAIRATLRTVETTQADFRKLVQGAVLREKYIKLLLRAIDTGAEKTNAVIAIKQSCGEALLEEFPTRSHTELESLE